MAGGLLKYSGLVTKTRAMQGGLLSEEALTRLSEYETVEDIIAFLREYGSYAPIYQSHEEIAHRAQVEAVIMDSLYADYGKLYRFAGGAQRQGLEIMFLRYEINELKDCLEHACLGNGEQNRVYPDLFFDRHTGYDTSAVTAAGSLSELRQALVGTRYEPFFDRYRDQSDPGFADYAVGLDVFYYETAWKWKDKLAEAGMREIFTVLLGTEIDWQNILWIYRCRKFYDREAADIYPELIPISYRLRQAERRALLEAEGAEEFVRVLAQTAYFTEKDPLVELGDEITYQQIMEKTYQRLCQKYPMSLAPVLKYLYDKEREIDTLTMILEGVRYRIPAREIRELVLMTG